MTDFPAPLTPADCDLRGLEWMPFFGDRLFGSETWLMASPEGRCAALALWWAAWKQRPAGSIPDQDRALAQLSGYGMAVKAWQAVRGEALRGWVKCADGRLYHPVVCDLARDAMERRSKERERKATLRARKNVPRDNRGTTSGQDADEARDSGGTACGRAAAVPADRTGQDRTEEIEGSDLRSDAPGASGDGLFGELPKDRAPTMRATLFEHGLPILRALTGKGDGQCRGLIGRWLAGMDDDCGRLYAVLREAEALRPADPMAWLTAAVRPRAAKAGKTDWIREEMRGYGNGQ